MEINSMVQAKTIQNRLKVQLQSDDLLLTLKQKAELCKLEQERAQRFFPRLVLVPVTELSTVNKSVSAKICRKKYCTCYPPFALQSLCSVSTTD